MKTQVPENSHDPQQEEILRGEIAPQLAGKRVDKALAESLAVYSRAVIQQWLKDGRVRLNGQLPRQRDRVSGSERYQVHVPRPEPAEWPAEEMMLHIVHADSDIFVIDKPAGLVVHPGAGNPNGTLLNGILHYDDSLRALPRAGIVHRLDKDTTGLLVLARTELARQALIAQLKTRTMQRGYAALVAGIPIAGGNIDAPIGRHRYDRLRMAVNERGKPALTRYRVRRKFRVHCLLEVTLESGRTHQIRVHMAWKGFPLVGDPVYGGRLRLPKDALPELVDQLNRFKRQALHAERLALEHPRTGETMSWEVAPPEDMLRLMAALEADWAQRGVRSRG